jgi:hypothetical protein
MMATWVGVRDASSAEAPSRGCCGDDDEEEEEEDDVDEDEDEDPDADDDPHADNDDQITEDANSHSHDGCEDEDDGSSGRSQLDSWYAQVHSTPNAANC